MPPDISVIIPAYNRAHCIGDAILSAACQQDVEIEIIVVDDASTDRTSATVKKLTALFKNLKLVGHHENRGVSAARNTGIAAATGDYIAFLDSDDLWRPNKLVMQFLDLETSLTARSRSTYSLTYVCYADAAKSLQLDKRLVEDAVGDFTGEAFRPRQYTADQFTHMLVTLNFPFYPGSTLMARRDHIGLFNEALSYGEDTEYLIRHVVGGGELRVIPEFLTTYLRPDPDKIYPHEERFHSFMLAEYLQPIKKQFGEAVAEQFEWRIKKDAALVRERSRLAALRPKIKTGHTYS